MWTNLWTSQAPSCLKKRKRGEAAPPGAGSPKPWKMRRLEDILSCGGIFVEGVHMIMSGVLLRSRFSANPSTMRLILMEGS